MVTFPKVATIQVNDNKYVIKDTINQAKVEAEKAETLRLDNILINNKALLAEVLTEKGVTTEASDTLAQIAENITKLDLGDSPALAELYTLLSASKEVLRSFAYNFPWVSRTNFGAQYLTPSSGTGGYAYERGNGNPEYRDVVAVTRLRNFTAEAGGSTKDIPIMFVKGLITFHAVLSDNNLLFKFNSGNLVTVPFPTTDTFTNKDFYMKIEVNNLGSMMCKATVSLSEPDADGRYTTFNVIHTETVEVSSLQRALYISMLGVPAIGSSTLASSSLNTYSSFGDYGTLEVRYQNYLRETCVAMKDENGIYKVIMGSSTLYPKE